MKIDKVEIRLFEPEHYVELMKGEVTEDLKYDPLKARSWAEFYHSRGPAFTGIYDGKVVGCAGVMIMWPGVGEAWILFNNQAAKELKKQAYGYVFNHLIEIIEHEKLHRVQAHCNVNLPHAIKYLENLGFVREGTMIKFDEEGNDHYLYAMVIER